MGNKNASSLRAIIVDTHDIANFDNKETKHSQRFFESKVKFIKRCCKIAKERARKVSENIEKSDILDRLERRY